MFVYNAALFQKEESKSMDIIVIIQGIALFLALLLTIPTVINGARGDRILEIQVAMTAFFWAVFFVLMRLGV